MNVLLFGGSGMIGGGVLTECLETPDVSRVVSVGRRPLGVDHPKLREVIASDLFGLEARMDEIGAVDACLYCLGVSSAGMSEAAYRRITLDLTVSVLDVLEKINPEMSICFVSGQGSGSDRVMWARVKGEAEEAVLARGFDGYVFRPGFIRPVKGARSRTTLYRVLYTVLAPVMPLIGRLVPGGVTTTEVLAHAMLRAAESGYEKRILEMTDINKLGGGAP